MQGRGRWFITFECLLNSDEGFTCGDMYHDLKGSKVVIKQRASLMERQITILEQSKYEEFKTICDDIEGKGTIWSAVRDLGTRNWSRTRLNGLIRIR